MPTPMRRPLELSIDGERVSVPDEGLTLLDVLRDHARIRSVKDGCSPQGQCGCCTVLVDGQPRVACVTPARRARDREVVTLDGLDSDVRGRWADAFAATGGSQCGFCTPGIICRFVGLAAKGADHADRSAAARALAAHLCRCTGWQPIVDAWVAFPAVKPSGREDRADADRRAAIEGHTPQATGPRSACGGGGFADDTAPSDALVAIRRSDGAGWALGESVAEARRAAGKIQGRRTTAGWGPPIDVPSGDWDVTLRTSWVEPGYLETDAAWCEPGGQPASPLANGGAFGGKLTSPVVSAARELADEHGRAVRVLWSREDVAAFGPKRPPIAAGAKADGTGVIRVARTPGIAELITRYAPGVAVEEIEIAGPPTSLDVRGAGWVETAVLLAGARGYVDWIRAPGGGLATADVSADGSIAVSVRAGRPLDEVVLRSYCTGAAHMALSWVTSESLGVDDAGVVHDLTIRSFGILKASAMPPVEVTVHDDDAVPVNGSDAVFAAVAAAVWIDRGLHPAWPTG